MVLGGPAVHLVCVSAVLGPTQKPPAFDCDPCCLAVGSCAGEKDL